MYVFWEKLNLLIKAVLYMQEIDIILQLQESTKMVDFINRELLYERI